MLIPFGILLVLVIYLIYTRGRFEKSTVEIYEKKFDEWKKHSKIEETKESNKQLVGLVFKKDYKVTIELLDESARNSLEKGKFKVENLKDN
jgi:cell division protein FtsB